MCEPDWGSLCGIKRLLQHIPHPVKEKEPQGQTTIWIFFTFFYFYFSSGRAKRLKNGQCLYRKACRLSVWNFYFWFVFFCGVPVSNLLNVQQENVCRKKKKKAPFSGESVTLSSKNRCACHVQSHLCIPHTCKMSIYCVRSLGFLTV